ncbi:MAG: hypothetical protein LIP02_00560 [Bacteroidales bacterium]|nr:hypothetical protein [Bacteroidales bacterium]
MDSTLLWIVEWLAIGGLIGLTSWAGHAIERGRKMTAQRRAQTVRQPARRR